MSWCVSIVGWSVFLHVFACMMLGVRVIFLVAWRSVHQNCAKGLVRYC